MTLAVGRVWLFHVAPPSVVMRATPPSEELATATQSEGEAHETAVSNPLLAGRVWLIHVAPRSVVVRATESVELATAMQSDGEPHEIPASDESWSLTLHPGVVAPAAAGCRVKTMVERVRAPPK